MSAAKHTPGPWELVAQTDGSWMLVHMERTTSQMAPRKMRLIAHVLARANSFDEDQANASVLIAAPDLAEALRDMLAMLERRNLIGLESLATEKARAALAKAGL